MSRSHENRVSLGESYLERAEIAVGRPVFLTIETTSVCNLKCIMCPYPGMARANEHMDWSLFRKIIDEASAFVEFAWLHLFGEPLLNQNIYRMIDYAENAGIRTGISTNCTALTGEASRKLLESQLSVLLLSLDGATKEVYTYVRAGADYDRVTKNVERFVEMRQGSSNRKLKSVLSIINLKPNASEHRAFQRKWTARGFDSVRIKPFHGWAGQLDAINQLGTAPSTGSSSSACYEPWVGMTIQADGQVVPCCNDFDGRSPLGHLGDQSILDVWNGEPMRRLRHMFRQNLPREGTLCENCPTPCATDEQARTGDGPFGPLGFRLRGYSL